ncbi:MAG: BspA family leucine-rich repeat surface protein [Lachnospira sp.]|nr:BspA family leucine-rich repeat surface protein [Lachnospira sp.]
MKRTIKKLLAIIMTVIVIAGIIPITGLEGIFKFNIVNVEASEADPYDTSKLTVVGSGTIKGAAWTLYDNGLLWVIDDASGNTSNVTVIEITVSDDFKALGVDAVYVYWNIRARSDSSYTFFDTSKKIQKIRLGTTFTDSSANITNMEKMFSGNYFESVEGLENLDTSNTITMSGMFDDCPNISTLDVSKFNTSKVTDMSTMFENCTSLKTLDVSGFNTSNVKYMRYMFFNCKNLSTLDVSGFNTSKVKDMDEMFYKCRNLKMLDVSGFDTSNVIDMGGLFKYCESLSTLDISAFDISNIDDPLSELFSDNYALHLLKIPANCVLDGTPLEGVWYKLNADNTIDRTCEYQTQETTTSEPLTLIRELKHKCDNVVNGRGTCSICNMPIMYGDNNEDGIVNINDAVILKKYLAGMDDTMISRGAANVNVDSTIGIEDAVKLMKYLAGVDVKLGVAD